MRGGHTCGAWACKCGPSFFRDHGTLTSADGKMREGSAENAWEEGSEEEEGTEESSSEELKNLRKRFYRANNNTKHATVCASAKKTSVGAKTRRWKSKVMRTGSLASCSKKFEKGCGQKGCARQEHQGRLELAVTVAGIWQSGKL